MQSALPFSKKRASCLRHCLPALVAFVSVVAYLQQLLRTLPGGEACSYLPTCRILSTLGGMLSHMSGLQCVGLVSVLNGGVLCCAVRQVEALTASKAQLRSQVRNLLNSQTDLLARVSNLTAKWQQAVAENAALQRQNLQLVASQGM